MSPRSIPIAAIACGSVSQPGPKRIAGSTSEWKRDRIGEAEDFGERSSLLRSPTRHQDQDDPGDQHASSEERRQRHAFAFAGLYFQRPRVHDRIPISPEDSAPQQDDHADGHQSEPNDSSCRHSAFPTASQRFNER